MKTNSKTNKNNSQYHFINGYIGSFGGSFVPPVLEEKLAKLSEEFNSAICNQEFITNSIII